MKLFKKEKIGIKRILTIFGVKFTYYSGATRRVIPEEEKQLVVSSDGAVNARELFLRQRRFDLIFKYIYLDKHSRYGQKTDFFRHLYCEHIRAFNNFYEDGSDYESPKISKEDFLQSFEKLRDSIMQNGFDKNRSRIPVDENFELHNGAHRLAVCAWQGKEVYINRESLARRREYKDFLEKDLPLELADFAALEYVRLNPDAYIVNLHAVTDPSRDKEVEAILEKYGFIFYKKEVQMNFNGYVNLKKLSYGKDHWKGNTWIGGVEDDFFHAKEHAERSMGNNPMRIYVFVCPHLDKTVQAKKEIRKLFDIGIFCIHINDNHEEALQLAQTYFNKNSLAMLKSRPYSKTSDELDVLINEMKKYCHQNKVDVDEVCGAGSTPLAAQCLRESNDFDFLYCGEKNLEGKGRRLSNHKTQLEYYPLNVTEIVQNPEYHFYYRGMKFITLEVLRQMKKKRGEVPKDVQDCQLIDEFLSGIPMPVTPKKKRGFKLYLKIRDGNKRTVVILGFIKFSYIPGRAKNRDPRK